MFYLYRDGLSSSELEKCVALLEKAHSQTPELTCRVTCLVLSTRAVSTSTTQNFLNRLQTIATPSTFPRTNLISFTNIIITTLRHYTTNNDYSIALELISQILVDFGVKYEGLDPGLYLFYHVRNQVDMFFFTDVAWEAEQLPVMFRYLTIIAFSNIPETRMDLPTFLELVTTLMTFIGESRAISTTIFNCLREISDVLFLTSSLQTAEVEMARGTFVSVVCANIAVERPGHTKCHREAPWGKTKEYLEMGSDVFFGCSKMYPKE